jgi:hypothetical protein
MLQASAQRTLDGVAALYSQLNLILQTQRILSRRVEVLCCQCTSFEWLEVGSLHEYSLIWQKGAE